MTETEVKMAKVALLAIEMLEGKTIKKADFRVLASKVEGLVCEVHGMAKALDRIASMCGDPDP